MRPYDNYSHQICCLFNIPREYIEMYAQDVDPIIAECRMGFTLFQELKRYH